MRIGVEVEGQIEGVEELRDHVEQRAQVDQTGEHVAFVWNGEKGDNLDVYIKTIGSPEVLRLTTDPGIDGQPSWSPDGRQIAFVHRRLPDFTATIGLRRATRTRRRTLSDVSPSAAASATCCTRATALSPAHP